MARPRKAQSKNKCNDVDRRKSNMKKINNTRGNKNQRRNAEIIDTAEREYVSKRNDFSWYNNFPQYTEFAATMAFGHPLGVPFDLSTKATPTALTPLNAVIPGIMTIWFSPTIGYSADNNSAINRATIKWYTKWRQDQKASADYDPADMMMVYQATDSIFMYVEALKRILGVLNLATPLNRYTLNPLLQSMGLDPQNIQANSAQLWGYINKLVIDLQVLAIPKDVEFRIRHQWMCAGMYTDADNVRAQMYIFMPLGLWKYSNTSTTGTALDYVYTPFATGFRQGQLATFEDLVTFGNSLVAAIFGDEDVATICGDVLNALGVGGIATATPVDRFYQVIPSYNRIVLSQIENLTAAGEFVVPIQITQNPAVNNGAIIFKPQLQYSTQLPADVEAITAHAHILNFHDTDKPTVEEVMEATRLTLLYEGAISETGTYSPDVFGSEIVHYFAIATLQSDMSTIGYTSGLGSNLLLDFAGTGAEVEQRLTPACQVIVNLSSFDWHPTIYLFTKGATLGMYHYIGMLLDEETTGILTPEKLRWIHDAALVSMFDMKQISS